MPNEGPQTTNRRSNKPVPRDVLCSCFFLLNAIFFSFVVSFAFTNGQPSTLVAPPLEQLEDEIYTFDIQELQVLSHDIKWILVSTASSIVLAVFWFFVIKSLTAFLIYMAAFSGVTALALLGLYIYTVSLKYQSTELLLLSIVCWVSSLALAVLLFVMREKILFTSQLIKESGKILGNNLAMLALALLTSVSLFILIGLSITAVVYLYSIPTDTPPSLLPITQSGDTILVYESTGRWLAWYVVFFLLWMKGLLEALQRYVISHTTYYDLGYRAGLAIPRKNILAFGFRQAFLYNFGTLVFASLAKGMLSFLNIFSKAVGQRNGAANSETCCGGCLFKFTRVIVNSVTDFSVIYSSFVQTGFWSSAKRVAKLLTDEIATTIIAKLIIYYVFAAIQLLSAAFITLVTVMLIESSHDHLSGLVVIVVFFSVYFVFEIFSQTYATISYALFLMALIDKTQPTKRLPRELRLLLEPNETQV